jgi:hypothetical protein
VLAGVETERLRLLEDVGGGEDAHAARVEVDGVAGVAEDERLLLLWQGGLRVGVG